jgi:hypothetical protein
MWARASAEHEGGYMVTTFCRRVKNQIGAHARQGDQVRRQEHTVHEQNKGCSHATKQRYIIMRAMYNRDVSIAQACKVCGRNSRESWIVAEGSYLGHHLFRCDAMLLALG